jgi:hypothetical protein
MFKKKLEPCAVVQTCNLSNSGGGGLEDYSSRPAQTKKFARESISVNKYWAQWCNACQSSYEGSINRRISVQAGQ